MTEFLPSSQASLNLTWIFAIAVCASLALKLWLASRQIRHVAVNRSVVPSLFSNRISLAAHQKAADYTIAKTRLGLVELAWGTVVILGWTLLGGLSTLNALLASYMGTGIGQQLALVGAFVAIGMVLDLPFSLYNTFVLEERFGFNKSSVGLWWADTAKSAALSVAVGLPFLALVLWMMGATGSWWWLWVWAAWTLFNLIALWVYPIWIAPLFNQFKPLEDVQIRERVAALMARSGFTSSGFFVMDGSRRSAHANAYFTGFGASKRVVFFDTLLNQLSPAEIDAVLAHELGHFKHRHVLKRMVTIFGASLLGLGVLGWLSQQAWFYTGLGVLPNPTGPNDALALLLFMMVLPLVSTFVGPWFAYASRRDEFQADAYAVAQTQATDLASALLKLYEDNASTLTPDPFYVRFYYSHPPAAQRLGRILELA